MKTNLDRRLFIKKNILAAGLLASAPLEALGEAVPTNGKKASPLRCVQIGAGIRASQHFQQVIGRNRQTLAAVVDPDEKTHKKVLAWLKKNRPDAKAPMFFTDYRKMFERIGKEIDAVFVATPNHQHALPTMMAIKAGIPVYCEKPLCHDIGEARKIRQLALENPKIATQMGNQGHCEEGYRSLCEYIWAGAIGKVTETHSWTDRANGGTGGRPPTQPVPAGLDWDTWIGPAPYRDYHAGLHPHDWHDWYDFGNGSIGNMGCHVLDGTFWALKLEHPDSIELEQVRGGSSEQYPLGSRVRWDFPARGDQPPVKVYWYEGLSPNASKGAEGTYQSVKGNDRNRPPLLKQLQEQYPDEEFGASGTIYVGEKGYIYTADYGDRMHIVPSSKMAQIPKPPRVLPRTKDIFTDFIQAVQQGSAKTGAAFEYGARLTEFALLGNLAQHAGLGNKIEWDGPGMRVKNLPDLNKWVSRENRSGWNV